MFIAASLLALYFATQLSIWGGPGDLQVVSVTPAPRSVNAALNSSIVISFDRPVAPGTIVGGQSLWAFGRWSGAAAGTVTLSDGNQTATLTPDALFSAGEVVTVYLSHDIQAQDGGFLRPAGYSFQFWTRTAPAALEFVEVERHDTFTPPETTSRAYGGIGSDLDGDGWLDLTIVNEDSADLRVFLNLASGQGTFAEYIQPTFPVGERASPSEPADFDRDGAVDICVANINDDSVSVLLGNGDGTFNPQQLITVGAAPRGIAVLDADGDGDVDIVNTNYSSSTLSLLTNNGSGVFGAPAFFEGGGTGERALTAADMDEDGVLDLVISAFNSQTVIVRTGNGDGTFSLAETQSAGGTGWMLVCGDVNGDGHDDVAMINSTPGNGAILLGDGTGQLAPPQIHPTDPFPLATDLGDLDGDGDLDWVTSSYSGDWFLLANNGSGSFAFQQEFASTQAASCALLMDIDNDRDLDLALVDEEQDEVILMKNSGSAVPAAGPSALAALLILLAAAGSSLIRRRRR
jgi:hypothetical protein